MALGKTIARLSVSLAMETGSFERGARKAEGTIGRLKNFLIGPGGLAVAAIGAATALVRLGIAGLKTADDIYKVSQSIGIGTEELSRLRYAADLSGVSFEQLTKGVGRLSRNMSDAANGLATPKRAFAELGIEVQNTDGTLRSSSEIISEVADRFSRMDDGAKKTALAMEIFGRAGADMIPFLNQGKDGIEALTAEADKFGIVIDEETGRKAEAFNDNLTRLGGVASNLGMRFAAELLPHLLQFTNWLVDNQGKVVGYVNSFGLFVVRVAQGTGTLLGHLDRLAAKFYEVDRAVTNFWGSWGTRNRDKTIAPSLYEAGMGMRALGGATRNTTAAFEPMAVAAEKGAGRAKKAVGGISEAAREAKREAQELASLLDRLFPEEKAVADFREDMARLKREFNAGKISADQYRESVARLTREFGNREPRQFNPFGDLGEMTSEALGQEGMKRGERDFGQLLKRLDKSAKDARVQIAKSFKDMADDTISALSRLTNSIKGGGFLGILEGLIGLGLQLGSIGAFGKNIAQRLNTSVPAYANGTNFHPGGLAVVGERQAELVELPRGSRVHSSIDALGGGNTYYFNGNLMTEEFWARINAGDMGAARGGAQGALAMSSYRSSRRVG